MEADERFQAICFVVMIILEVVLIAMIVMKVKMERKYISKARKMQAVIRTVNIDRSFHRFRLHRFVVKAENDYVYNVSSSSHFAERLKEGDTVYIYVPEFAVGHYEDPHFEDVMARGEDGIRALSHEEKLRLNDYLDRRFNESFSKFEKAGGELETANFVFDGGGQKSAIITMTGVAAVIGLVAVVFLLTHIP